MTDHTADQLLHHVPDEQAALAQHGMAVRAVCGRFILPAALSVPEGPPCPRCALNMGSDQCSPVQPTASANAGCLPGGRRLRGLLPVVNLDQLNRADPLMKALVLMPTLRDMVDALHVDDGTGHCRACPRTAGHGFHIWPCAVSDLVRRAEGCEEEARRPTLRVIRPSPC